MLITQSGNIFYLEETGLLKRKSCVTQRSDRSGIKCNCKKCKAMSLRTNSKAVYYNTSVWRQERNLGYISHMLGDYKLQTS